MPRPLRIEFPGACYHVICRSNARLPIFEDDSDKELLLDRMVHFAELFRIEVRAYCLMTNHIHIHLRTLEANLGAYMRSFLTSFTSIYNHRHASCEHVFQGRYKAYLVEDAKAYVGKVTQYIHLNPVRIRSLEDAPLDVRHQAALDCPVEQLRADHGGAPMSVVAASQCRSQGLGNELGRRTHAVIIGTAFTEDTYNRYRYDQTYNDYKRSELSSGEKFRGTNIADMTDPVYSYGYHYDYDNIGSRDLHVEYVDEYNFDFTSYTANQLNQYTAITGLTNPDYDEDGNMTLMPSSNGDWNMTWNGENRLVMAEDGYTKLEFTYDYIGRRIEKKVSNGGEGNWTLDSHEKFICDGWNLIAVLDAADSNSVVRTYTWGLDLSQSLQGAGGVGGLLAVTEHDPAGDETYHPTYDANGNVSEYIDDTGTVVAHYEYCPFGQLTVATGVKAADFAHRFSSKYLDSETSLYYYGYRYYSAVLGRWISRDPIEEQGGLNLYGFVGNDGVNGWDVLGMKRKIRAKNIIKRWPPLGENKFRFSLSLTPSDAVGGGGSGSMIYTLDYSWTTRADVTYCDCDDKIQTESGTLEKSGTLRERNANVPLFQTRQSDAMLLPTPAKSLKKLLFSVLGGIAGDVLATSIDIDANIFIIDGLMNDEDALDKLVKIAPRNINNMEWIDLQFIDCD